jgi:hypothetical protein
MMWDLAAPSAATNRLTGGGNQHAQNPDRNVCCEPTKSEQPSTIAQNPFACIGHDPGSKLGANIVETRLRDGDSHSTQLPSSMHHARPSGSQASLTILAAASPC